MKARRYPHFEDLERPRLLASNSPVARTYRVWWSEFAFSDYFTADARQQAFEKWEADRAAAYPSLP